MLRTKELQEIKDLLLTMKKEILADLDERIKSSDVSEQRVIGDIFDDGTRTITRIQSAPDRAGADSRSKAQVENGVACIDISGLHAFTTLCVKCKSQQESMEGHVTTAYVSEKG